MAYPHSCLSYQSERSSSNFVYKVIYFEQNPPLSVMLVSSLPHKTKQLSGLRGAPSICGQDTTVHAVINNLSPTFNSVTHKDF